HGIRATDWAVMIMASRLSFVQSLPSPPSLPSEKYLYLRGSRNVLHFVQLWVAGRPRQRPKGRVSGVFDRLSRYYASIAIRCHPNWDVTFLRLLRNFAKQFSQRTG